MKKLIDEIDPEAVCRAALLAVNVPKYIVDDLRVGRVMDAWVHLAVMNKVPWQQVQAIVDRATEEVLKTHGTRFEQ